MRFELPVSDALRKAWTLTVPEEITNASYDSVAFHIPDPSVSLGMYYSPVPETPNYPNQACYACIRKDYGKFDVVCYPKQRPGIISFDDAYSFLNYLTEDGVVPEGVLLWEEKEGILCKIPKGIASSPNIYAALCCYRWIDAKPLLVWEFIRLMKQEKRHSLQVLPYLASKYRVSSGHSFLNLVFGPGIQGSCLIRSALNPCVGLGAKLYFDPDDARGSEDYKQPLKYVNAGINSVVTGITPTQETSQKISWCSKSQTIKTPRYLFSDPVDGLHPDLYELYTTPQIPQEQINKILEKLFTTEKKA